MLGRLFIAFLVGLAVAGGVSWYLNSRPEPVTAAAVSVPEPAPPAAAVAAPAPAEPVVVEPLRPAWRPSPARPAPPPARRPAVVSKVVADPAPEPERAVAAKPAPIPAAPVAEPPVLNLPLPAQRQIEMAGPRVLNAEKPEATKPAAPREPRTIVIPAGTLLTVRLNESLDSGHSEEGHNFRATLDAPLIVDNLVLAERGSVQRGRIVSLEKAGRVRGTARLGLALTNLSTSDGQTVDIETEVFEKKAERASETRETAKRAGVGAAIGAAIGAIAGGGKGAAIGAAVGGGAGAGSVLVTRGSEAALPSETRISFRLKSPVTLTEKIR